MDPSAALVPSLNDIDPKGTYFMKGNTLIEIRDAIRSLRLKIENSDNSPLVIREIGPTGTILALNTDTCPS